MHVNPFLINWVSLVFWPFWAYLAYMWYVCGASLLFGYARVTQHKTILGSKLVGKSQQDLYLTRSESRGIQHITGILGNVNKYLMINWELLRSGGNSGSFDYNVPGGVFGTSSTMFYLRLLKLKVACQIEPYVRKPLFFFPIVHFNRLKHFRRNLEFQESESREDRGIVILGKIRSFLIEGFSQKQPNKR